MGDVPHLGPRIFPDWDRLEVPQIWEILEPESEHGNADQVSAWQNTYSLLDQHRINMQRVRDGFAQAWPPEGSEASREYLNHLDGLIDAVTKTSEAASANAYALSDIVDTLVGAKSKMQPIRQQWDTATPDQRQQLNTQARQIINDADQAVYDHGKRFITPPQYDGPGGLHGFAGEAPMRMGRPVGDGEAAGAPGGPLYGGTAGSAGWSATPGGAGSPGGAGAPGGAGFVPGWSDTPTLTGTDPGPGTASGPGGSGPGAGGWGAPGSANPGGGPGGVGGPGGWGGDPNTPGAGGSPRGGVRMVNGVIDWYDDPPTRPGTSTGSPGSGYGTGPTRSATTSSSSSSSTGSGSGQNPAEHGGGMLGGISAPGNHNNTGNRRRSAIQEQHPVPKGNRPIIEPDPEPGPDAFNPGPGVHGIDR